MWPRSEDRGKLHESEYRFHLRGTSMWPRSEDRGKLRPRNPLFGASSALQCGHGPRTVENLLPKQRPSSQIVASMWPRSEDRGKRVTPVNIGGGSGRASMWPRSEDRGKQDALALDDLQDR